MKKQRTSVGVAGGEGGGGLSISQRGEGRRELTEHGVLPCSAGIEGHDVPYCTACPAKKLLSCKLLAIPAAAAADILPVVLKTPT